MYSKSGSTSGICTDHVYTNTTELCAENLFDINNEKFKGNSTLIL